MSTNISKEKRENLIGKIKAIREYIAAAPQDENTGNLLTYLSEIEKDIKGKKYGLVFEEHRESIDEILATHTPVLSEDTELFIDKDGQMNFLIEGDNLASLQLLQKTHKSKIDFIYIDPPYNTGNKDFIYDDKFVDSTDTFKHSKWLSFMKKRLELAIKLLSPCGLIFISIDDREYSQIKSLCDQIFNESNFVANLIWKSKSGGANDASSFGIDHEYILCFAKNISEINIQNDKGIVVTTCYNKTDADGRKYSLDRLDKQSLGYQSTLDFPIIGPDGKQYVVEHKDPNNKKARWRWGKETVEERYDELVFIYPYVYTKNYEKTDGQKPRSILFDERFGRTRTGSTDLKKIIGNQNIFNYPKPTALIKFLAEIATSYTPGKGNLEEQSKAKMDKYIYGASTKLLCDVMTSGFNAGDSCFINWEKLTKKGNTALRDSERTNFLEHIEKALDSGITFKVIVDESHQNDTTRTQKRKHYA